MREDRFDIDVGYMDPTDDFDFAAERSAERAEQRADAEPQPEPWRNRVRTQHQD